jgi:hypothetical protein
VALALVGLAAPRAGGAAFQADAPLEPVQQSTPVEPLPGPPPEPAPQEADPTTATLSPSPWVSFEAGWTNQMNGKGVAFGDFGLGLMMGRSGTGLGLMATMGFHPGARFGAGLALQGGHTFEAGSTARLTLLGELGLSYLVRSGKEEEFLGTTTTTTGGDSRIPYVGGRLIFRTSDPSSPLLIGLVAKQTLKNARVETTTTVCSPPFLFSPGSCEPSVNERFIDGGTMIGLTIGYSFGPLP